MPDVFCAPNRFVMLFRASQTGSGKTAAFLLPIISRMLKKPPPAPPGGKLEPILLPSETFQLEVSHKTPFHSEPCRKTPL